MNTLREFLTWEDSRNRASAKLCQELVLVFLEKNGYDREQCECFVGHHVSFMMGGDLATENEIPSIDTLLFSHQIMEANFGSRAESVMVDLAKVPANAREERLRSLMAGFAAEREELVRMVGWLADAIAMQAALTCGPHYAVQS